MPQETPVLEKATLDVQILTPSDPSAPSLNEPELADEEPAILDELIIEEVDIDGMCGVY